MRYLILDLETVGVANAVDFIQTDDIEAPSNYKDVEKIKAYIAAERVKRVNAAALDLDLARVCVIGLREPEAPDLKVTLIHSEEREAEVLGELAEFITRGYSDQAVCLVTFNGHRYDLPLLMRRALYLGVSFPSLNLDRYRSPHIDLYEVLSMRGAVKAHGLRWYMRRLGMTDLLESDPLEHGGGDVAGAVADGRWDDIAAHCRADVLGTFRLAQWMGLIPQDAVL